MTKSEAGRKGGLATKAKYGVRHFSIISKHGGRPPLPIIPPNGSSGNINKVEGGKFPTDLISLKRIWRTHPLNPANRGIN